MVVRYHTQGKLEIKKDEVLTLMGSINHECFPLQLFQNSLTKQHNVKTAKVTQNSEQMISKSTLQRRRRTISIALRVTF